MIFIFKHVNFVLFLIEQYIFFLFCIWNDLRKNKKKQHLKWKINLQKNMKIINTAINKLIHRHPELWTKQLYKVGNILINANDSISRNFYIKSGIIKCYDINDETLEEFIIAFFSEGDIIFPNRGHYVIPSNVNFKIIEDAILYSISAENWNDICKKEPVTDELLKNQLPVWVWNKLVSYIKCNSYSSSSERYKKLIKEYPFLLRLKDEDIANHLGINRRTILRIKTNQ